jgi:hypothetical protein
MDGGYDDAPITGAVCRVQPQWSHKAFCDAARPRWVMLNLKGARILAKRGLTASEYFPAETGVITTSTMRDEKLDLIPWVDNGHRRGELDIVQEVQPDYHIPADYSDYHDLPDDERRDRVKQCVKGTLWMKNHLGDDDPDLIPLMKGKLPVERQLCYELFDELDPAMIAVYVANHFNAGGDVIGRIQDNLDITTSETDLPILMVGLLSPNYLARVHDQVVAGAGQHTWRDRVTPREENDLSIRQTYENLEHEVATALGLPEPDMATADRQAQSVDQ